MRTLRLLTILCCLVCLAACSSDDDGLTTDPQDDGRIKFEMGFAGDNGTKVATDPAFNSTWQDGDEIGIFAVKAGETLQASGNSIHNMKVTYDGTKWDGAYWPNDENKNENLDFYAYYPYDAAMTNPTSYTFRVNADQRIEANYNKSDLLLSKAVNQSKGTTVQLTFSHALSLVQVEFENGGLGARIDDMAKVYLRGIGTSSAFNLSTGTVTANTGEAIANILMTKVDGMTNTYRVLVPAQTISAQSSMIEVVRGDKLVYATNVTLQQNNVAKYKITLQAPALDPAHIYAVGDAYPYLGLAEGVVYEISNGGVNGKIVSLDRGENMQWGSGIVSGIADIDNGRVNLKTCQDINTNFSNYPSFAWVHAKNNTGTTYQAGISGVWYLPSKNELKVLYANMSGKKYEDISGWGDLSPMPESNTQACKDARTSFNAKIVDVGGDVLYNGTDALWLWSSSEHDKDASWCLSFDNNGTPFYPPKSNSFYVRAIMTF